MNSATRRKTLLVSVVGALALLAVACGAAATTTPAPKPTTATPAGFGAIPTVAPQPTSVAPAAPALSPGKVTWMVGSFGNERFDYTFNTSGHDYSRQIHGFLISSDVKEGKRVLTPGLATKWEVSSDGLTWTLTIRKGGKFHDGKDVTAADVAWTLQHTMGSQAKDYAMGGDSATMSRITTKIEQSAPDQVSVATSIPTAEFLDVISEATGSWVGVVYPKRTTLHSVEEEAAYDRNPIGAGLAKLVKHVPAAQMTFERFADYYYQPKNGLPTDKRLNFTTLDLRLVPEEATRVAALRAGDADIAPVSLATRKQVEAGGGRILFGQEGSYFRIRQNGCWNKQYPCSDKRVRQALAYAINKEIMRDQLYGGPEVMQIKGWTFITPSTTGYSPELDPFPFDPNKARQLLADAGYPGGKGFGKLIVHTWKSTATPLMPEAAQLAADNWKRELGLEVEVRLGEEAALKKASSLTEELYGQILWRDNETRIDGADSLRSGYGTPTRIDRTHNDPEIFARMQKATAVSDRVERAKVLNEAYRQMRDEAVDINLGYVNIPWGLGSRIKTWEPYPLAFYPSALHTITLK